MAPTAAVARTFVELADTLGAPFDLPDFLHLLSARAAELLGIADTGVLLIRTTGELPATAASTERMRSLALVEVQQGSGPSLDGWRTATAVREPDLTAGGRIRWPGFADAALAAGVRSVYVLPMRRRSQCLGVLRVFASEPSGLSTASEALAQALADVATIFILQQRSMRQHAVLVDQLSEALRSRVVLEQAKGVLAEQGGVDLDVCFEQMRRYARNSNLKLAAVARQVVDRQLSFEDLVRRPG